MADNALTDSWREWIRVNKERGCSPADLFERAFRAGFRAEEISRELDGYAPAYQTSFSESAQPLLSSPIDQEHAHALVTQQAATRVRAPRIAESALLKVRAPDELRSLMIAEYEKMTFPPTVHEPKWDPEYGVKQYGGISAQGRESLNLGYSPMSAELLEACYTLLTPMAERWARCRLVRSWGHGIRSYGNGSILHLHRDRTDTHVISCIMHVDDRSATPWPLDFIDHEGVHQKVTFDPGDVLFYESLCPHARLTPFNGDYYRNAYLHWRPEGWDPATCKGLRSKYKSIEDCLSEIRGC